MPHFDMIIDGRATSSPACIEVIDPATEAIVGTVPDCTREQLDESVAAARAAYPAWRARPHAERQDALRKIAATIMAHKDELQQLLTAEQGKPLAAAMAEIEAAAWWIGTVAESELPVHTSTAMPGQVSVTTRVPLGVVGAIVPWNFPVLLAVWKIGPALLTGNTMVLKPSPNTPLATLRLGALLQEVLPPGVLNMVSGGDALGPWMSAHPGIDKISFTGSTATGRKVMESAAGNLKRLTLELGGNDAAIVLPDVDVDAVAEKLFWAAFANSGQVCVAAKRLYVHDDVYDEVLAALKSVAERMTVGDGRDAATALGPVQNRAQFERVRDLIRDAEANGYRLATGGEPANGPGFFVPVTLVDNPPEDSRVVQEEAFGPVLPILRYSDIDDVIARANACEYGLGGSVWSSDLDKAAEVAARLETGTVWINSAQGITPFAAFAGHKQSGIGAENGTEGLLEFTVPQTIYRPEAA
ncbi:aldehyde dehydrogenase family protein [Croceicoccus sp. BE223]|uniref:aldehyde dehydrogenase family protein n=1 Tax=Croceicoccus sp. BE223 TaxID=2817716 RepID=UPI00285E06FD|nr:aldehyde dehydrogenase family protein [Croceicoccus sp. BE223]MDR7104117.1 acyl-CoA reductase-like NAD-dependent aldehyde dehydrogenase [Croceicoccus sp. BE223]